MEDATGATVGERQPETSRSQRVFHALFRVNGWSLAIVGALSLAVSVFAAALAGALVSAALILHGALEIALGKRAVAGEAGPATRKMALNQIGLAASLTLYFAYQLWVLDPEGMVTGLLSSPVYDVLLMYPEEVRGLLVESLPSMARVFYLVAAVFSWLFCGGTALYYAMHGRAARPSRLGP